MNIDDKQLVIRAQRVRLLGIWHYWLAIAATPGFVVVILAALSLLLQLRFLLRSDIHYLAVIRMQDDSFYYLQPAWHFRTTGTFTFDGETPTYGFQPLWMLMLAGLSYVSPDKIAFMRLALALGAGLYCATGLLLYRLSHRLTSGWRTVIAPALWLINPALIAIYTTGKENALYVFLLVAAILYTYRILSRAERPETYVLYGSACGLLVLSRVNSLVFVVLLMAAVWSCSPAVGQQKRLSRVALMLAGLLVIVVPWAIYSSAELGSIFPNSGTQKLIGSKAALIIYAHHVAPWLPIDWLASLLPATERLFLQVPDKLVLPSIPFIARYGLLYLPRVSLGSWGGKAVAIILGRDSDPLWLPQLIGLAGLGVCILYSLAARARMQEMNSRLIATRLRQHLPMIVLFIFAGLNTLANGFLLPNHIYYATWYAVPETLTWLLLASVVCMVPFNPAPRALPTGVAGAALGVLLLCAPIATLYRETEPQPYPPEHGYSYEALQASSWIHQNLPAGARVASWSSGLLGYFTDNQTIVNLDGLANSPDYVTTVWLDHKLYVSGLTSRNELWAYIRSNKIEYIADAEWAAHIGKQPLLMTIPVDNYEIVYRGSNLIQWGEVEGPRWFVVARLHY